MLIFLGFAALWVVLLCRFPRGTLAATGTVAALVIAFFTFAYYDRAAADADKLKAEAEVAASPQNFDSNGLVPYNGPRGAFVDNNPVYTGPYRGVPGYIIR